MHASWTESKIQLTITLTRFFKLLTTVYHVSKNSTHENKTLVDKKRKAKLRTKTYSEYRAFIRRPYRFCQFLNGLPSLENTASFFFGLKTINRNPQSNVVVKRSLVLLVVLEKEEGKPLMREWEEGC